jgi:hypothetical protein
MLQKESKSLANKRKLENIKVAPSGEPAATLHSCKNKK